MDDGYRLRGGRQPDVAALTNLLDHYGFTGVDGEEPSEPLVFLASGGIGTGYRLSEFTPDGSKPLTLQFRHRQWEPLAWLESTSDRLGAALQIRTTARTRAAAKRLDAELPALVLPEPWRAGYWPLSGPSVPHFVVAYGRSGDGVLIDDRSDGQLTVDRRVLAKARSAGQRNLSAIPGDDDSTVDIRAGVRAGLAECALGTSTEPWENWARLVADERAGKGWPTVFADRRGLVGALLSVWDAVSPDGTRGGHLRDLFADGLTEAATLLDEPALGEQADAWRAIAARWEALGDAALPEDRPEFTWMRGLVTRIGAGVRAGDADRSATAEAAAELRRLRTHYDAEAPFTQRQAGELFTDLTSRLRDIHERETAALAALNDAVS